MRTPLTSTEIIKLLGMTRVKGKQAQFLQLKRDLEQQLGYSLSDSQVRLIMRKLDKEQLAAYELASRPAPELGASHITAQRLFYVHPELHLLESFAKSETWYPGEIKEAKCVPHSFYRGSRKHEEEVSPVYDCSCGIWVCDSRAALRKSFPNLRQRRWVPRLIVSAQVEVWGKCIEHQWGWRAQYARVIAETIQIYPRVNGRRVTHERLIGHLRKKYGAV